MTIANDNTGGASAAAKKIDQIAGTAMTAAIGVVSEVTDAELADLRVYAATRGSILALIEEAVDIETLFRRGRPDLAPEASR